jgi:hypothetical protein
MLKKYKISRLLILGVLMIGLLVSSTVLLLSLSSTQDNTQDVNYYHYGSRNLVGATTEQVAAFAKDYAKHQLQILGGDVQVLHTSFIKKEDLPALGFDRISFASIEEPPLAFVVLKGDFAATITEGNKFSYIGYVFDMWAASPTYIVSTSDITIFDKVLNKQTSIAPVQRNPSIQPTPDLTKTLHYGQVAPTASIVKP